MEKKQKKQIFILGANGLLGNTVLKYFQQYFEVVSNSHRWPSIQFKKEIDSFDGTLIINCIGAIPQKVKDDSMFWDINFEMPKWIDENAPVNCKIIHPTTDCEFDGKIKLHESYDLDSIGNAEDIYGKSKLSFTKWCLENSNRTKILRSSIIGLEKSTNYSLLSWFLSTEGKTNGYLDHFWNGMTTLEWAKWALKIYSSWDNVGKLTQLGAAPVSKFELLNIIKKVWRKDIIIEPVVTNNYCNKVLKSQITISNIETQLEELLNWKSN